MSGRSKAITGVEFDSMAAMQGDHDVQSRPTPDLTNAPV